MLTFSSMKEDKIDRPIVKTKEEFIFFLKKLSQDFRLNQEDWENQRVDSYLEAVAAYTEDVGGLYKNIGTTVDADTPSWQLFTDILLGSKHYE